MDCKGRLCTHLEGSPVTPPALINRHDTVEGLLLAPEAGEANLRGWGIGVKKVSRVQTKNRMDGLGWVT